MNTFIGIIIIILCILLEGFFAGSEIGVISCNRIRISSLADKGDKRAKVIVSFLKNPERFLSITLVGVNLSIIICSSVATAMFSRYFKPPSNNALIVTTFLLPFVLVFGEMMPKVIYQQFPDRLSILSAYPLRIASIMLFFFVSVVTALSNLVSGMFVKRGLTKNPFVTREELRLLVLEAAREGVLDENEIYMTKEIFDFGKTGVQSVMVPLDKVISASIHSTTRDILELISESGYSRIPIYSGSEDNIIGTVEMSDLVAKDVIEKDLKSLILPPYKVKWNKSIAEVLRDFQENGENVAIVINDEEKSIGIATIEDIIEEIVGEIEDEYDVSKQGD